MSSGSLRKKQAQVQVQKNVAAKQQMQMGKAQFGIFAGLSTVEQPTISVHTKTRKNAFPERKQNLPVKSISFDPVKFSLDPNMKPPVRYGKLTPSTSPTREFDPILATQESNSSWLQKSELSISLDGDHILGPGRQKSNLRHGKLVPLSPTKRRVTSPTKPQNAGSLAPSPDKDDASALRIESTLSVNGNGRCVDRDEESFNSDNRFSSNSKVLPDINPENKDYDDDAKTQPKEMEDLVSRLSKNQIEDLENTKDSPLTDSDTTLADDTMENTIGSTKSNATSTQNVNNSKKGVPKRKSITSNKMNETKLGSAKSVDKPVGCMEKILKGCLNQELPPELSSVIRIFLSSTFTDFKMERNYLTKHAYPVLQEYCIANGLSFEVVDLRWGITDEVVNEHLVEKLCLLEIENCKRISPHLNFVALLGDRYGYIALPAEIPSSEFYVLFQVAREQDIPGCALMSKWYQRDTNSIPPTHVLQPIKAIIAEYAEDNADMRKKGRKEWDIQRSELLYCLQTAAEEALAAGKLDEAKMKKYTSSVTEQEIMYGLLGGNKDQHNLCIKRKLINIENDLENDRTHRFIDVDLKNNEKKPDKQVKDMRKSLFERLCQTLPKKNIMAYDVHWHSDGIYIDNNEHLQYLKRLCEQFVTSTKVMINNYIEYRKSVERDILAELTRLTNTQPKNSNASNKGNEKRKRGSQMFTEADFTQGIQSIKQVRKELHRIEDETLEARYTQNCLELYQEVLHHLHIGQEYVKLFSGRKDEIAAIEKYLKTDTKKQPFIVHSHSGMGKSSLLASVAQNMHNVKPKCVSVIRFIGTSSNTSTILQLVSSICSQICLAYYMNVDENQLSRSNSALLYLQELISYISVRFGSSKPLVIILDSIDKLTGNTLILVKNNLPAFIHMIISIRDGTDCSDSLVSYISNDANCLQLGTLKNQDVTNVVELFYKQKSRSLMDIQKEKLLQQLQSHTDPMYISLMLEATLSWRSTTNVSHQVLPDTVYDAISNMFFNLEGKYGKSFIDAILGSITLCMNGISDRELEDLLSMNDKVLDEVYKYHDPPVEGVVRIPSLMFARVKHDLKEYLGRKLVNGETKFYWSYQYFHDAAAKKYLSKPAKVKKIHEDIVSLFSNEGPYLKTVNLEQRKLFVKDADRLVSIHQMVPGNKRKLSCLIYHSTKSGNLRLLKEKCILNANYLECYAVAFGVNGLMMIFDSLEKETTDKDILYVSRGVRLNAAVIKANPKCLSAQLLCYLRGVKHSAGIVGFCESIETMMGSKSILPNMKCVGITQEETTWYLNEVDNVQFPKLTSNMCFIYKQSQFEAFNYETNHSTKIGNLKSLPNSVAASNDGKLIFALFADSVCVYNSLDGNQVYKFSNRAQSAENLQSAIVISEEGANIFLANPGRLGKFENINQDFNELEIKPKAAMNLGGSVKIFDFKIFEKSSTVSTHEIKDKSGAIIVWDHEEQKLTSQVGLPSLAMKGFLHIKKYSSQIVCGCQNGQIFMVDMSQSKIIHDFKTKPFGGPALKAFASAFDSIRSILVVAMPDHHVRSWDVNGDSPVEVYSFEIGHSMLSLDIDMNSNIVVGLQDGQLGVLKISKGKVEKYRNVKAHGDSVEKVICTRTDSVFSLGKDKVLKQWDIDALLDDEAVSFKSDSLEGPAIQNEMDVQSTTFTADSDCLLTGTSSSITAWSSVSGESRSQLYQYNDEKNARKLTTCIVSDVQRMVILKDSVPMLTVYDMSTHAIVDHLDLTYDFYIYEDCLQAIGTTPDHKPALLLYDWDQHYLVDSVTLLPNFVMDRVINLKGDLYKEVDSMIVVRLSYETLTQNQTLVNIIAIKRIDIGHFEQTVEKKDGNRWPLSIGKQTVLLLSHKNAEIWCPFSEVVNETKVMAEAASQFLGDKGGYSCHCLSNGESSIIVIGSNSGKIQLLPNVLHQRETLKTVILAGHKQKVTTLQFAQNDEFLISGSNDRWIFLWSVASGTALSRLYLHAPILYTQLSPNEKYLTTVVNALGGKKALLFTLRLK